MKSIRRTLLVTLIVGMSSVMLIGAYATYRVARNEANTIFDYYLRQIALSFRDHRFLLEGPSVNIPDEKDFDFVIRVWNINGVTVYYSRPHRVLPNLTKLGYSTVATSDGTWRVFAAQYMDETIEVAQPLRVRDAQAAHAALRTLTPYLFLLPLLGMLIWIIVVRGLRPLTQLTQAVLTRTPDSLEPLYDVTNTSEVQPLISALNALLARLETALHAQRAFVADAAHELRTPLTALQLQIQLLERSEHEVDRHKAVTELKTGLHRTIHVIQQLLTLARQEPDNSQTTSEEVELNTLMRDVVIQHQALAHAKQIDLGIADTVNPATVRGNTDSLNILFSNLVSNAVRYTPENGKVDIRIAFENNCYYVVTICDTGSGIPPEEKPRVFDRFYRRPGHPEPGSGLGLAIVKTIAERMQARVDLRDNPDGGLCVHVEFHQNS